MAASSTNWLASMFLRDLPLMGAWMGSGWITSPGGPCYGEMKGVSEKDGDYVNVHKTKEIRTHTKGKIQNDSKVWCIDLQEGQEVQVCQSLPLVQFDPEQNKLKQCLILKKG